ncbi:hypothetical protein F4819DRAFT_450909 [Hypoxylon fuscum]|nr:hypothetical protein F4819DRAFT_450909 [Hypoxylon fuscum]
MDKMSQQKTISEQSNKDIFSSLPQELVVQIIDHLDFPDILNCHLVSDEWRYKLFGDRIPAMISRRFFADNTPEGAARAKYWIMQGVASKLHGMPMPPPKMILAGLLGLARPGHNERDMKEGQLVAIQA